LPDTVASTFCCLHLRITAWVSLPAPASWITACLPFCLHCLPGLPFVLLGFTTAAVFCLPFLPFLLPDYMVLDVRSTPAFCSTGFHHLPAVSRNTRAARLCHLPFSLVYRRCRVFCHRTLQHSAVSVVSVITCRSACLPRVELPGCVSADYPPLPRWQHRFKHLGAAVSAVCRTGTCRFLPALPPTAVAFHLCRFICLRSGATHTWCRCRALNSPLHPLLPAAAAIVLAFCLSASCRTCRLPACAVPFVPGQRCCLPGCVLPQNLPAPACICLALLILPRLRVPPLPPPCCLPPPASAACLVLRFCPVGPFRFWSACVLRSGFTAPCAERLPFCVPLRGFSCQLCDLARMPAAVLPAVASNARFLCLQITVQLPPFAAISPAACARFLFVSCASAPRCWILRFHPYSAVFLRVECSACQFWIAASRGSSTSACLPGCLALTGLSFSAEQQDSYRFAADLACKNACRLPGCLCLLPAWLHMRRCIAMPCRLDRF